MMDDTLDDRIDRVAADLTRVAPDPAFAAKLEARLGGVARGVPLSWMAAAAAAAALAIAAIVTFDRTAPVIRVADAPAPVGVVAPAPAPPVISEVVAPEPVPGPSVRRARRERVAVAPLELMPTIAALAPPEAVSVTALSADPLTIPPVDEPAGLEVPALALRAIAMEPDFKEQ